MQWTHGAECHLAQMPFMSAILADGSCQLQLALSFIPGSFVSKASVHAPGRQKERRADIQSVLQARGYERTVDLSEAESSGIHLEGTGAFVLDRINGVAYVALSERADLRLAQQWVQILGYRVCICHDCLLTAARKRN